MMTDSTEEIKIEGGMSRDYVSLNVSKEWICIAQEAKEKG
jgi:hypothetical protein